MRKRILSLTAVIVVVLVALLGFAGSGSAAPPPPVTNYQVVTATVQVVNQSTASLTAACPTGKRVLGGGARIDNSQFFLHSSAPTTGETAWQGSWRTVSLTQESATATVTAFCANTT
jgi:hypothetical protein